MHLKTSVIATVLIAAASMPALADTIDDAIKIQEQSVAQQTADQARSTNMAMSMNAAQTADLSTPTLFSVMAMGKQCSLKFVTTKGSFIATESKPDIDGRWKLVSCDGLSALIVKKGSKPIRVYLSVPDDIDQAQTQNFSGFTPPFSTMSAPQP